MKPKKIPMRMCNGCMEMKPKGELVRLVKAADGTVFLDLKGKQNGRGAYLCKSKECFLNAVKARRFEKAFSCKIPEEIFKTIERELESSE